MPTQPANKLPMQVIATRDVSRMSDAQEEARAWYPAIPSLKKPRRLRRPKRHFKI